MRFFITARRRRAPRWLALGAMHALSVAPAAAQEGAGRAAPQEPIPGLHAYVARAMQGWDAPGLALVLVRGDSIYAHGYGVTEAGRNEPVDVHTLFGIGSLTKAFTATLFAMLVDEGKLAWDDPVIRYLPELTTHDPYVTEHLTIRDVLSHRTGLAGDDLMWAAGGMEAGELIRRMRLQKPAFGFRAGYGYNNLMYLVAGELAARVAGKPWPVLVRERIFEPLGMKRSTTGPNELRRRSNVALPHDEIGPGQLLGNAPRAGVALDAPNTIQRIEWFDASTAPAGAIGSSAAEFGQWLRFQLGNGEVGGRRLVGANALLATRTPQILTPGWAGNQSERSATNLAAYGMGWGVRDYRGALMLSHLGSTPGWSSAAALLPAERTGVAVFTNISQGSGLADAIMRWMLDRLLGPGFEDWNEPALKRARERREAGAAVLAKAAAARIEGRPPSLPLSAYAGTYADSIYPAARIALWNGRLRLVLGPNLSGHLDHWQDDTFRVTWDRADFGANFVAFEVGDAAHPQTMQARILGRQAVWRRSAESPDEARERVLDRGDPGRWDAHSMFGPYVLRHQGLWYMFYTGGRAEGVAIGYATSPDGLRWTKARANPVFAPAGGAGVPVVRVLEDGTWVLLYERTPRGRAIYRATAPGPDGPWTAEPKPVLESRDGVWDRLMFPNDLVRVGNEWRIYYTGRTAIPDEPLEAMPRLGLATSPDARTWRLWDDPATARAPFHGSDPLLSPGPAGDWDEHGVAPSNPLRTDKGWELFYVGFPWPLLTPTTLGRGTLWLGHATSLDGLSWKRSSAGPLIDTGELRFPLIHAVRQEGHYLIYYDWRFGEGIGVVRIGEGRVR